MKTKNKGKLLHRLKLTNKIYIIILIFSFEVNAQSSRELWQAIKTNDTTSINNWITNNNLKDTTYRRGRTPVHMAVFTHNSEMLNWLVCHNFKLDVADGDGMTPLLWAVTTGDSIITEILIKNRVNIHVVNHRGESVLHEAVIHKQYFLLRKLLAAGADRDVYDKNELRPVDYVSDPDIRGILYVDENR